MEILKRFLAVLALGPAACATIADDRTVATYDTIIRGGTIYDGSGKAPYIGDVGIRMDRIGYVGPGLNVTAREEIDAAGLAVAPGFINMLSAAPESLLVDPRSQSDIRQGVTLEVTGEGWSMGPLDPEMKRGLVERQGDIKYTIPWTSLGEFLEGLERKGVSPNIASFVGATTVRIHELGEGDVDPTPEQLTRMRALVREAMDEGAMGLSSALIYAPGSYAETVELVALAAEAGKCRGMYITHIRSEGDRLVEAVDEVIEIARRAESSAEIYHLKMAGRSNWGKLDEVVSRIEASRASGQQITANMYTYTAGAIGLQAAMPTWVQAGGIEAWIERLKDPAIRVRVAAEMKAPGTGWENLYHGAGADGMLLTGFRAEKLKPLTGKRLSDVAKMRGKSPEETAMDLVIEDGSRVGTIYFLMSEDNVRRQVALPWMSFGSDAGSQAPEGVFLLSSTHPRSYGNFARVLGRYARDEKVVSLQEAVRRLTSFPAANLGIEDRGRLKKGYFADVAIFDPSTVADRATFEKPQQYSIGMRHVFVNGTLVLRDGEHTGAMPGRVVRGPGWNRCKEK